MRNRNEKKMKISHQLIIALLSLLIAFNVVGIMFTVTITSRSFEAEKESTIKEVNRSMLKGVEAFLQQHIAIVETASKSSSIIQILEDASQGLPLVSHPNYHNVLEEMRRITQGNRDVVELGLGNPKEDNLWMSSTNQILDGSSGFSLRSRPYFQAISEQKTVITAPYVSFSTGEILISVASPVYSNGGQIVGLLMADIQTDSLEQFITQYDLGESGRVNLIDQNNNFIVNANPEFNGKSIQEAGFDQPAQIAEITHPTGKKMTLTSFTGVKRVWIASKSDFIDWKVLTAMDRQEFQADTTQLTFILILIQVLIIVGLGAILSRKIQKLTAPLTAINTLVKDLSEGKLDGQIDYVSDDEIGQLARNLSRTTRSLKGYVECIRDNMQKLAQGDFNIQLTEDFRGEFKVIEGAVRQFSQSMSHTLGELITAIQQVSMGTDQVSSIAQNLAQGAAEQSSGIADLNQLIHELVGTIQLGAKNSQDISAEANKIQQEMSNSDCQMKAMLQAMDEITGASNEISKIINEIEDVAFQTNILALNAAVEAARAGTVGKGFAVVADEVRKLASKTSKSAQNTAALIQKSIDAVKNGSQLAHSAASSVSNVGVNVNEITNKINAVSQLSIEQTSSVEQVKQILSEISHVVQDNSATSEESAASSEELSAQSRQMAQLVQAFQLIQE